MTSKKCSKCLQIMCQTLFNKNATRKDGLQHICKNCQKNQHLDYWSRIDARKRLYHCLHNRSRDRGIPVNIQYTDIYIPDKCPVLDIPMFFSKKMTENTPTVDRLDPKKGYTKDNICVISSRANRLKNDASLEELEAVINYIRRYL